MNYQQRSEGVFTSLSPVITADAETVSFLKQQAANVARRRARLCAHHTPEDPVHEMLIALHKETYVAPHAHKGKTESFHVIEGCADLVLFEENGDISRIIPLGPVSSGRTFYFRLAAPFYHTVLIHSELLVIHETTTGPFRPNESATAPWAPPESDREGVAYYLNKLRSACRQTTREDNPERTSP